MRIKDRQSSSPSHALAVLFSTYTKAINRAYERTGSLFEKPFRRKLVDYDRYFISVVTYIHRNAQKHGFVPDFRDWPYSSYAAVMSTKPTRVQRDRVLEWFGGRSGFEEAHRREVDESKIEPLIGEDWM